MRGPTSESYWFEPGRLLAGKYPGSLVEEEARRKVAALVGAGVRTIVDLTEDGDALEPYAHLLPDDVGHVRRPIVDMACATEGDMVETLDVIDSALAEGIAYVHCWGGCGRTGTVLACHLVRHGTPHEEALERVSRATQTIGWFPGECPQTRAQFAMVCAWRPGR